MTPVCLDLTRLTRRAALPQMTGIDRVEHAYLLHFLSDPDQPLFGLIRAGKNFFVLDRDGVEQFQSLLDRPGGWGEAPWTARFSRRPSQVITAEARVADMAVSRMRCGMASEGLSAVLPQGCRYLNIGHTNLNADTFGALTGVRDCVATVFVHDTIPIDWPEYQRKGQPDLFTRRLRNALTFAHDIIVPSTHVKERVSKLAANWGLDPETRVAPLGLTLVEPDPAGLPERPDKPYFVTVGTIEPRKNHALLLDLWATLPQETRPALFIVGRRGWRNSDVFARLDARPSDVIEVPDLNDEGLAALLDGAAGLLHPSFDEGFGLPPHEAAARGVVPVCAPLAAFHEALGEVAIYADPSDLYQWRDAVEHLAKVNSKRGASRSGPLPGYVPPTWAQHFKDALRTG